MMGPMFATFIAALSVRYRMSRIKIIEYLSSWLKFEISIGTIDRCIREAGVACFPVVEQLIEELQKEDIVHVDETPWYETGLFKWLWVFITKKVAIYFIGSRKKEVLDTIIATTFYGWLITDGYVAYRSYEKRQRCLAHLIRKAVGISEALDEDTQKKGDKLLKELRSLIKIMSEDDEEGKEKCKQIIESLKLTCVEEKENTHTKLRELCSEILNDWDAVVAFVYNPELPLTNNEAERALRHAVIARRISFGTRTCEGSKAYATLLSVIETCRLRNVDPWSYIAQTIALGRKGISPLAIS